MAGRRRGRVVALVVAAVAVLGAAWAIRSPDAGAEVPAPRYAPPEGRILSGAAVEYGADRTVPEFLALTEQPGLAIVGGFVGHMKSVENVLSQFEDLDSAVMLSWRAMAENPWEDGGTLTGVAEGEIDDYLVESAQAVADYDRPVFLRPLWEFTGDWFPWSTYDHDGEQRAGNSPEQYRRAWQRMHVIFAGGTREEVDARLADLGLPPLTTDDEELPAAEAAWVWSVSKAGVRHPNEPHETADYYPGDAFVDWVGQGLHQSDERPFSFWASEFESPDPLSNVDAVYDFAVAHGKPFMLSEWGIATAPYGNGDDPEWIDETLTWLETHPEAKAQVYFNREKGSYSHELEDFWAARQEFSDHVDGPEYIHAWPWEEAS
jgi:hypothetical protein